MSTREDRLKMFDKFAEYRQTCINMAAQERDAAIACAKAKYEEAEKRANDMEKVARESYDAAHPDTVESAG